MDWATAKQIPSHTSMHTHQLVHVSHNVTSCHIRVTLSPWQINEWVTKNHTQISTLHKNLFLLPQVTCINPFNVSPALTRITWSYCCTNVKGEKYLEERMASIKLHFHNWNRHNWIHFLEWTHNRDSLVVSGTRELTCQLEFYFKTDFICHF